MLRKAVLRIAVLELAVMKNIRIHKNPMPENAVLAIAVPKIPEASKEKDSGVSNSGAKNGIVYINSVR